MTSYITTCVFLPNRKGVDDFKCFLHIKLCACIECEHTCTLMHADLGHALCERMLQLFACVFRAHAFSSCIHVYVSWCVFILVSGSLILRLAPAGCHVCVYVCVCGGGGLLPELLINSAPGPQCAAPIHCLADGGWRESSGDQMQSKKIEDSLTQ